MLKSLTIDLVLAPKGGVGKTALSEALIKVRRRQITAHLPVIAKNMPKGERSRRFPLVGIDLNTTNIDLFRNAFREMSKPNPADVSAQFHLAPWSLATSKKNFKRIGPEVGGGYYYRRNTPSSVYQIFDGIGDFWQHIEGVIHEHPIFLNSFDGSQHPIFDSLNLVVDTNLHIASLPYDPVYLSNIRTLSEVSTIFVWFIWTLTSLNGGAQDGVAETLAIGNAYDALVSAFAPSQVYFMHAFNPIAYARTSTFLQSVSALFGSNGKPYRLQVDPLFRLSKKDTTEYPMSLDSFITLAGGHLEPTQQAGQLDAVFDPFVSAVLRDYNDHRPFNLIPIPFFYKSLLGYTEGLSAEADEAVDRAKNELADLIAGYLE